MRQYHSTAEKYAEAVKHLQERLEKYRKIYRVLLISALGLFVALFFTINAVPEVTKVIDKRKVGLAAELGMLEKKMEGVKEEMAGQQAFVKNNPVEEEEEG